MSRRSTLRATSADGVNGPATGSLAGFGDKSDHADRADDEARRLRARSELRETDAHQRDGASIEGRRFGIR